MEAANLTTESDRGLTTSEAVVDRDLAAAAVESADQTGRQITPEQFEVMEEGLRDRQGQIADELAGDPEINDKFASRRTDLEKRSNGLLSRFSAMVRLKAEKAVDAAKGYGDQPQTSLEGSREVMPENSEVIRDLMNEVANIKTTLGSLVQKVDRLLSHQENKRREQRATSYAESKALKSESGAEQEAADLVEVKGEVAAETAEPDPALDDLGIEVIEDESSDVVKKTSETQLQPEGFDEGLNTRASELTSEYVKKFDSLDQKEAFDNLLTFMRQNENYDPMRVAEPLLTSLDINLVRDAVSRGKYNMLKTIINTLKNHPEFSEKESKAIKIFSDVLDDINSGKRDPRSFANDFASLKKKGLFGSQRASRRQNPSASGLTYGSTPNQ